MKKILKEFYQKKIRECPDYPFWYCNIASKELQKLLWDNWIETKTQRTYEKPGDWHTFLVDTNWIIIDPTYGQYDENFQYGFYWDKFPNEDLNNNIIRNWKEYMMLQLERIQINNQ